MQPRARTPVPAVHALSAAEHADALAQQELVPVLVVEQLDVAALQRSTVAMEAVPLPMPLRIDRMDVEPLSRP